MREITKEYLKEIRRAKKYSVKEMARRLCISPRTLEGYEGGRKIPETIKKLVRVIFPKLSILFVFCSICCAGQAEETRILAETIAAEACSEGYEGLQAVANVIRNRAISQNKTPYQIITAKNQFYGYTNKNRTKIYKGCKKTADYLAENIMNLPDITGGAEYFLLPSEKIRAWHGEKTVTIKKHTFYKGKL